jgi:hypothetical protein
MDTVKGRCIETNLLSGRSFDTGFANRSYISRILVPNQGAGNLHGKVDNS